MSCLTGWKLAQPLLVLSGASQHLSPSLRFRFICYHFALRMTFPWLQPDQTSPHGCEHCVKPSCRGRTLVWTSMLVNHSLASWPKAPTMLLLTAIQLGKKSGPPLQLDIHSRRGRDHGSGWRCASRAPSSPLVMLCKQLGVYYTGAASCRYVCGTLRTSTDET